MIRTLLLTVTAALLLLEVGVSHAQQSDSPTPKSRDRIVQVNVSLSGEPATAVGLILNKNGVRESKVIDMRKVRDGLVVVSFYYSPSDATPDAYASAQVTSTNGAIALGDIRSLALPIPKDSFHLIPVCPSMGDSKFTDRSKVGALEMLVAHRDERRVTYQKQIRTELSGQFLSDLKNLDQNFGIEHGAPLTADLNPHDLLDRLSRINTILEGLTATGE